MIWVWAHLGGQWAFLMCGALLLTSPSLLSPPGSSSLRVDSLPLVRCVVAHARAGTTSDRTELVHEKASPAWTLTACGPHAWAGNGWDGGGRGQSLFTKSVHSDRVNWLACACGDGPGRFSGVWFPVHGSFRAHHGGLFHYQHELRVKSSVRARLYGTRPLTKMCPGCGPHVKFADNAI